MLISGRGDDYLATVLTPGYFQGRQVELVNNPIVLNLCRIRDNGRENGCRKTAGTQPRKWWLFSTSAFFDRHDWPPGSCRLDPDGSDVPVFPSGFLVAGY